MPTTTPQVKIDAVKGWGSDAVEVVLHGDSYSDAYTHAVALEKSAAWRLCTRLTTRT